MRRKNWVLVGLVVFLAFMSGGWLLQRGAAQAGGVYQRARILDNVVAYLADYYVDSLEARQLYDMAIDGLLRELGDPYTSFLRPNDIRELQVSTTGNYGGLGIRIEVRDGWITVVAPLPDTPADRAGLRTGDRIVQLNGESTYGWSDDRAVRHLRGEPGSAAEILVSRPGVPEPMRLSVTRERIHVRSVQFGAVLPGEIGYVHLTPVSEASAKELQDEVTRLRGEGARSLILDLRYNPGGLLDEGVAVADLFLASGSVVVETRGRAPGSNRQYRARSAERWADMPLVVLVNHGSASAAEIIAGALQDHDRALLVGTPTFGKGLVQTVFELGASDWLKVTTGRWYTPSGRTIERPRAVSGSDPVVAIEAGEEDDEDLPLAEDSLVTYRTSGGRIVHGGGGIHPDRVIRNDTLNTMEQAFARALGADLPKYRDALAGYAFDLSAKNIITDPDLRITREMRSELLRRARDRGIEVSDSVWHGAARLIDRQLGDEIVRYVFGRPEELRRQMAVDPQIQEALRLLREARSPSDLMAMVGRDPAPR